MGRDDGVVYRRARFGSRGPRAPTRCALLAMINRSPSSSKSVHTTCAHQLCVDSMTVKRRGTLEVNVPPLTEVLVRGDVQDVRAESGLPAHDVCWDLLANTVTIRCAPAIYTVQCATAHQHHADATTHHVHVRRWRCQEGGASCVLDRDTLQARHGAATDAAADASTRNAWGSALQV